MPSQPPPESAPSTGESEEPEAKVTRGNFQALAKGLFRVSPEQYAAAEARHDAAKAPRSPRLPRGLTGAGEAKQGPK